MHKISYDTEISYLYSPKNIEKETYGRIRVAKDQLFKSDPDDGSEKKDT